MNIVIPMAGAGSRFDGYTHTPKPLIPVNGDPMILSVLNNIVGLGDKITLIANSSYLNDQELWESTGDYEFDVIWVNELTEGPACTALLARDEIDNDEPLMIINCDQIIDDYDDVLLDRFATVNGADGVIGCFLSSHPKNSYVKVDPNGLVTEVKEKIVISNLATNGLHYWARGEDFVSSALDMIGNDDRYNGEFYVAPTYNYMIKKGMTVLPFFYNLHWPIGTPEDLQDYEDVQNF